MSTQPSLEERVRLLERKSRRERALLAALVVAGLCGAATVQESRPSTDTLTARHLLIQDSQGRTRIHLGEDPPDTQRRSRACGVQLLDATGAERFGVGTMKDLSVVLGLDSPHGVGDPMRDRIGLSVEPDGSASITLIDNRTLIPVRLVSEAGGGGGVEFIDYDFEQRKATITRLNSKGESRSEVPLGERK
jgi:hypothetical protein